MKEIDFLIFYEHKNREFESIALLKHELVRRGHTVEFLSFYEHNPKKFKMLYNNVNIVIMPSLYHDEEILNFVYRIAGKAKNIVNLRWEQVFSNITEKNLDYYVFPKGNAKMGYHCCWGQRPFEMLVDAGVSNKKLKITGPIQMDFLRNEMRDFYLNRKELFEQYGIDDNKKCILFTSSFSVSCMNKWTLDWYFSQYDEKENEYNRRFFQIESESRKTIIEWLIRFAKEKDCNVIYRPHPSEAKTELVESLKEIKNIKVISDYNIKQWILTCDQVYTWNSTSIAEASVAGVPCAALRPVAFDEDMEMHIYDGFPFITSFQQFVDYYEDNLKDSSSQFVNNEMLKRYMDIDPNTPSYMRTADVLENALKDDYFFPWENFDENELKKVEDNLFKYRGKDMLATIVVAPLYHSTFTRKVANRLFSGLTDRYVKIKTSKNPPITDEEFKLMEERISSVLNKNQQRET